LSNEIPKHFLKNKIRQLTAIWTGRFGGIKCFASSSRCMSSYELQPSQGSITLCYNKKKFVNYVVTTRTFIQEYK
jgi:hypothetical protein